VAVTGDAKTACGAIGLGQEKVSVVSAVSHIRILRGYVSIVEPCTPAWKFVCWPEQILVDICSSFVAAVLTS